MSMGCAREIIFIDSSVLISCGRRESPRFHALAREARNRDTVFRLSPQVYAEVTGDPALDSYLPERSLSGHRRKGRYRDRGIGARNAVGPRHRSLSSQTTFHSAQQPNRCFRSTALTMNKSRGLPEANLLTNLPKTSFPNSSSLPKH